MTQQKQNQLTNWLLGLIATIASAGFFGTWSAYAKLTVLIDHDTQHTSIEGQHAQKIDDLQINLYDTKTRVTQLEDKTKTR